MKTLPLNITPTLRTKSDEARADFEQRIHDIFKARRAGLLDVTTETPTYEVAAAALNQMRSVCPDLAEALTADQFLDALRAFDAILNNGLRLRDDIPAA